MPAETTASAVTQGGLVAVGVVRGAYGLHGWARVTTYDVAGPALRAASEWHIAERIVAIEAVKRHGAGWVAKWQGFDNPESVDALKGSEVWVPRAAFPPVASGEAYWIDLIGATVVNRAQQTLGQVKGVRTNGAHDLMEVQAPNDSTLLIPMVETYVDAVDAQGGVVKVDWEADWS